MFHHDLGKLGNSEDPLYVQETSDWSRKNLGRVYKHNDEINYMDVTHRYSTTY